MEKFLEKIYDKYLMIMLNYIPEDKTEEFKKGLSKFVEEHYSFLISEQKEKSQNFIDSYVESCIEQFTNRWKEFDFERIKIDLGCHENYKKFKKISNHCYNLVFECIANNDFFNDDEEHARLTTELMEAFEEVKHIDWAREQYGDALLELDFAFGKSEAVSLRAGTYCGPLFDLINKRKENK